MKPIEFSHHAREQMLERGASEDAVIETIHTGERVPAKRGRQGYRKNFQYNRLWGGRRWEEASNEDHVRFASGCAVHSISR